MDIAERRKILDSIKQHLLDEFKDQILSAIIYGSTLGDDYCSFSDFDILLIFRQADFGTFQKIRNIKNHFAEQEIEIDFNSHIYSDLPEIRKEVFWHNNRGLYVQKELAIYGEILFGKKYFKDIEFNDIEMLSEAVKVISSLNYQIRKMLSNKELNTSNRIIAIKWCIYGVIYLLASQNCFPKSRRDALIIFNKKFNPPINPKIFLDIKVNRPDKITIEDLEMAYTFLAYLDRLMFDIYEKKAHDRI